MNRKTQIIICILALLMFGCLGMEEIDRQSYYPLALPCEVLKSLLGFCLIGWVLQTSVKFPRNVATVCVSGVASYLGIVLFAFVLAIPYDVLNPVVVRGGLSVAVVGIRWWYVRKKFPKSFSSWVQAFCETFLVFVLMMKVTHCGRYGFTQFHDLGFRIVRIASFRVAELLAWAFTVVIAWFAWWLSERPDDRRRLCGYWIVVGICFTSALCWRFAGIATVLLGAGIAGAFAASWELPGRQRIRSGVIQTLCLCSVMLVAFVLLWCFFPSFFERIRSFILSEDNRYTAGYLYARMDRLFAHIPLWEGVPDYFGSGYDLPDYWRGLFLITTTALWGWYSTLIFVAISIWLCWLLVEEGRWIADPRVRSAAGVLIAAIILQTVYGYFQNFGWMPMLNLHLPFSEQGLLPFCTNAFFVGLLLRFRGPTLSMKPTSSWPFLVVPLVFILLGCGGYMMRRVESNACRREILGRQENLLRQIMAETDGMLAMIEERGELGDFSKCRGLNRYSPLDDSICGMGRGLFAAGRIEEALQRMERAIALIRSVQKDEDLEAVAFILNGYADLLDRSSQIEKALPIYREASEIWCHLKQREDPSVKRRAVRVKDVRRHSQAYRKGIGVGDVILSYDGDLLFDPRQLINRTIRDEDDPGEVVTLELLKNGEIEERVVLTGRLGVTLEPCWLAESESARRERQVDAHEETDLAHSGDPVGVMAEHGEISR